MTQIQFTALVRQLLTLAAGYLIGTGKLDAASSEAIIGGLVAASSIGWAAWASRKAGVVQAAATISNVSSIQVTTDAFADKVPSEKVQSE